jgi:hypothetical protein
MALTRLIYDKDANDLRVKRIAVNDNYRIFPSFGENITQCYSLPTRGAASDLSSSKHPYKMTNEDLVRDESYLTWRHNKHTKGNTRVSKMPSSRRYNKPTCLPSFITEDSRFIKPIREMRGLDTTEYKYTPYLYSDPQDVIFNNTAIVNTRLVAKDRFVPKKQEFWADDENRSNNRINFYDGCQRFAVKSHACRHGLVQDNCSICVAV